MTHDSDWAIVHTSISLRMTEAFRDQFFVYLFIYIPLQTDSYFRFDLSRQTDTDLAYYTTSNEISSYI